MRNPTESTLSNVTDVILVVGAGLDKPLAYVRLEPMKLETSTEEPNEKIDATADTDFDDDEYWGAWEDEAPDEACYCDLDCDCGNGHL
jgi:hypothetical protein